MPVPTIGEQVHRGGDRRLPVSEVVHVRHADQGCGHGGPDQQEGWHEVPIGRQRDCGWAGPGSRGVCARRPESDLWDSASGRHVWLGLNLEQEVQESDTGSAAGLSAPR